MTKSKKIPSPAAESVASAQAAVDLLTQKLGEARADVARLEAEVSGAWKVLREAWVAADSSLPQCRVVSVHWRGGTEEEAGRVVILKKTPTGTLVTRRVGHDGGIELRFKWAAYGEKFVQAEKSQFFGSNARELRDVPPEFLPIHSQGTPT